MEPIKKVMSPKFRVSFPVVFQSKKNDLNGNMEFSIVMLIPKDLKGKELEQFQAMKALVRDTALAKWGAANKIPKNFRNPIRDGAEREREEYNGMWFVSARSKHKPGLVDENVQPIIDQTQFYAGCYARASLTAYAYDMKGNAGVSFGLQNIQKVNDGEPLAGSRARAEDEFESIGGGGAAVGASAPTADDNNLFG